MNPSNFSEFPTPVPSSCVLNCTFTKLPARKLFPDTSNQQEIPYQENIFNELKRAKLTGTVWRSFRVNALYDFSFKKHHLFEYSQTLSTTLFENTQKNSIEGFNSSLPGFVVNFKKLPICSVPENDDQGVIISIHTEGENEEHSECLNAFLLSIGREKDLYEEKRREAKCVILPLLLVDCVNKVFEESLIGFLESMFSTLVSPLEFSPDDLKRILTLFSSPMQPKLIGTIVLEYETPFSELKYITHVLDSESVTRAWEKVMDPEAATITEENVKDFISIIEDHFYSIYKIRLSRLQLCKINTPLGHFSKNCDLEILDSEKGYFVLKHLTHIALVSR